MGARKLSEDDIKAIRNEYCNGTTIKKLSKKYDVSLMTICNIIHYKSIYKKVI